MTPSLILKRALGTALHLGKRLRLGAVDFGAHRKAAIVRYHSVSEAAQGNHLYVNPGLAVTPAVFSEQIAFLVRCYHCVTMDDVHEALVTGRPLPANAVAVTFDDGYRDNYEIAYPILKAHGVSATFYVTTGSLDGGPPLWMTELRHLVYGVRRPTVTDPATGAVHELGSATARERAIRSLKHTVVTRGHADREAILADLRQQSAASPRAVRERMLTWTQVCEMHAGGMRLGAHTVTHPRLTTLPRDEAFDEIATSRDDLRARLGASVDHFAYPNPADGVHHDDAVRRLVAAAGFATAVTSTAGYVEGCDDRYGLARMNPSSRARALAWDVEREALRFALSAQPPDAGPPCDRDRALIRHVIDLNEDAARLMRVLAHAAAQGDADAEGLRRQQSLLNEVLFEVRAARHALAQHQGVAVSGGIPSW